MYFRLLGNFLEAAKDLRLACKIDFDDQADEWLREVTPNVSIVLLFISMYLPIVEVLEYKFGLQTVLISRSWNL